MIVSSSGKVIEAKKTGNFTKYLILGIGVFFFIGVIATGVSRLFMTPEELAIEKRQQDSTAKAQAVLEKENDLAKARKDTIQKLYFASKLAIKGSMKNPDSYDEVDHKEYFVIKEKKDFKKKNFPYIQVYIKYRGTNSFNAIVTAEKLFSYDKNMNLIKVE